MKNSVAILALLALSISCSKVQEAEKNMNTMKDKTDQMAKTTDGMKETTTDMYVQIRSKESEDTRSKKFEVLYSKEHGWGARIAAASVYFKSFEFQLWTGKPGVDNSHIRQLLIKDAADEFTKRICDLYEKINTKKMSPTKDGKSHRAEMSFYALAATMHMNHHYQEILVENKLNTQSMSFYDVIKNALEKERNGMNLIPAEKALVTIINREIIVELIKARVDMLSALALKNLTDKRDMTLGQKIKAGLFQIFGKKFGTIDLPETWDKLNEPTKEQTVSYLDAALKAKIFLDRIGVDKELEPNLHSAFSNIDLGAIETPDVDVVDTGESKVESDKRRMEIRNLIDLLLQ